MHNNKWCIDFLCRKANKIDPTSKVKEPVWVFSMLVELSLHQGCILMVHR